MLSQAAAAGAANATGRRGIGVMLTSRFLYSRKRCGRARRCQLYLSCFMSDLWPSEPTSAAAQTASQSLLVTHVAASANAGRSLRYVVWFAEGFLAPRVSSPSHTSTVDAVERR